ncbi:NrfD/PsrC family molybdoenzyme membrane anchor subunit [Streptomyces sp. NPDC032940]|uniref:NrfD/PsrC family molybdoenzyme membrane anchor subunit n=1 Tax=Streptomyces sp. NPDC032940 TaxID=3155366 RepID=UPI0033D5843C
MTGSEVTRDAVPGARPGREAPTGAHAGRRRRRRRPGRATDGAGRRVSSYYGRPVLNKPRWAAPDIAGNLWPGGLAGASSLLAAGAHATGHAGPARTAKLGAAGAVSLSLGGLVHDLGRPSRFLNMLRVFKPTSPMNVGSWLLAGHAPLTVAAAAAAASGRHRSAGAAATVLQCPPAGVSTRRDPSGAPLRWPGGRRPSRRPEAGRAVDPACGRSGRVPFRRRATGRRYGRAGPGRAG